MKTEYFKTIYSMFNFSDLRVEVISVISACIAAIGVFSKNSLGISEGFFLAMFVLMFFDFVTGIGASLKRGEKIESKKGIRSLFKGVFYLIALYILFTLDKELADKFFFVEDVVHYLHLYLVAHMVFWELLSVDENLKELGIELGVTNTIKKAFKRISEVFDKKP